MTDRAAILAIDQGTTSSRAIVFDPAMRVVAVAQQEFGQHYPNDGWVEHDPDEIWQTVVSTCRQAMEKASADGWRVEAIGITNQRETTVWWDGEHDRAVYPAIVWQDRRTAERCEALRAAGHEADFRAKTGLLLDPYFSCTKLSWLLDNVDGTRRRAANGELKFGTIDSYLVWRLTGGAVHATDATNASRTGLYDIHTGRFSDELTALFDIPAAVLPVVKNCADDYGATDASLFGRPIPILGVAGDQQAAAIGQGCFGVGDIKSTYGTGCFVLINTGTEPLESKHRLLSTVAYRLDDETHYALEGSIFVAGAAVQWLRDGIRIIDHARDTEAMAASLSGNDGVYLVPAFTGLGAPHWNPDVRGAVFGLSRATTRAHLVRAALESVCYQTHDLLDAMRRDGVRPSALRVDGGMVANDWLLQFLADVVDLPLDRPTVPETTAVGAAYLAGLRAGLCKAPQAFASSRQVDARFEPAMDAGLRGKLLAGWSDAVRRLLRG